jgi:hypothetical protein
LLSLAFRCSASVVLDEDCWWRSPKVDVSPYPSAKHQPLAPGGSTLFLVDDKALPVRSKNLVAPLPMRFFAVNDDERLAAYVKRLNEREQEECRKIYEGGAQ